MVSALITLYKLFAVRAKMCSTSEDVLCKSGISSVQASRSSILVQGGGGGGGGGGVTTQKYYLMNKFITPTNISSKNV